MNLIKQATATILNLLSLTPTPTATGGLVKPFEVEAGVCTLAWSDLQPFWPALMRIREAFLDRVVVRFPKYDPFTRRGGSVVLHASRSRSSAPGSVITPAATAEVVFLMRGAFERTRAGAIAWTRSRFFVNLCTNT